jgi:putative heme-binding domain-containing protein
MRSVLSGPIGKVFFLLLVVLGTFVWIGNSITALTGGEKDVSAVGKVDISPEGGEEIFWGKGRCYTCHSVGDRGSAVRCPNLGVFGQKFALAIGARASERAKLRSEKTGEDYTSTDYLVESLAKPDAYVVEGFKNEMAIVFAPPISLNVDEIKAVIAYLQSQDGEFDIDNLENPSGISAAYFQRVEAATAAGGGDPGAGEVVYEDNCTYCHILNGEGEEVGPDLTGVGSKGLSFLEDAIINPAKAITKGYETSVVVENDGRQTKGLLMRDDPDEIDIVKDTGDVVTIARSDIKEITVDETSSVMPGDINEALTVKDFQDLLSYLMLQKQVEEGS